MPHRFATALPQNRGRACRKADRNGDGAARRGV